MAAHRRRGPSPRRVPGAFPRVPLHMMANNNDLDEPDLIVENGDPLNCHVAVESLLTAGTEFRNFSGFFNWAVILLMLTYVHVNLELINKHGFFGQFGDPSGTISLFCKDPYAWPALYLMAASNVFITIALFTESFMTRSRTCEVVGMIVQCVNLLALLTFPMAIIHSNKSMTPVGSMLTLLLYVVLFFKLVSYTIVNGTYRARHPKNAKGTLKKVLPDNRQGRRNERGNARVIFYPSNLNLQDLYYFVAAPTLCYQVNYPKTTQFRLSFFIARVGEMVIMFQLMVTLVQHLILPDIQRCMKPMWEVEASHFLKYILKLAVATNFIWLIFFYWFFHSFLNALAELLYFADREFYQDWWNTTSILKFWTKWNRLSHNWLFRHVYMPLKAYGYEKLYLQGAVFLFSAIFFEALIAVPLRMYKFLIFTIMSTQFLLALVLEKVFGDSFGNLIMWLNVFLGIPLVLMLYFHDYYVEHRHTASSWGLYY